MGTVVTMKAPEGFTLPRLDEAGEGLAQVRRPVGEVDAVHHDTPDMRLARAGILLCHRIGEGLDWSVSLPDGAGGERRVEFAGPPDAVPDAAVQLLRAHLRGDPLVRVARAIARRGGVDLDDADGRRVASVDEDDVTVQSETGNGPARLHLLRLRVEEGADPALVKRLVKALRKAGADPDDSARPALVSALGPGAEGPADLEPLELPRKPTAADALRAAIGESVARIVEHDPGARLGDPHGVHQCRVGTRRLRSNLKTYKSLIDDGWRNSLDAELKWLAGELGQVRDADVLHDRLVRQARDLPAVDAQPVRAILTRLENQRAEARARLVEAMSSDRHAMLIDRLVRASAELPVLPAADARADEVLPRLARAPWRKLRKEVAGLPADPPDHELHRVRIRAKRARYAAEAASAVVGGPAARFASAVADLQGVLGDHQDAVVAEGWLRSNSRPAPVVAGELVAAQRAEGAESRAAWSSAWRAARKKGLRRWMD